MDLLGKFDFGKLIRLALPGLTSMMSLCLFADVISHSLVRPFLILNMVAQHQSVALALGVPLALACGLLLNAAIFVSNINATIRKSNDIRLLTKTIITATIERCDTIGLASTLLKLIPTAVQDHLSLESFLLPILPPEKISFNKSHFYYYMHFDVAFGLSLGTLEISFLCWMFGYYHDLPISHLAFWCLLVISMIMSTLILVLLFVAAKRNAEGDKCSYLSLYLGALCLVGIKERTAAQSKMPTDEAAAN